MSRHFLSLRIVLPSLICLLLAVLLMARMLFGGALAYKRESAKVEAITEVADAVTKLQKSLQPLTYRDYTERRDPFTGKAQEFVQDSKPIAPGRPYQKTAAAGLKVTAVVGSIADSSFAAIVLYGGKSRVVRTADRVGPYRIRKITHDGVWVQQGKARRFYKAPRN